MVHGSWYHWQNKFRGKKDFVCLHGFTSCSLDRSTALTFAWENKVTGHSKVLILIKFLSNAGSYFVDTGAYDHEKEVLLQDGTALKVVAVEEIKDPQGNILYTLITLKT